MPRFDIDEDSPLYTGPPSLSAGNNDVGVSPSDLAPTLPVPMSMQNPNGTITKPYIPTPNYSPSYPKPSTESIANTMQAFRNSPDIGIDQFKLVKSGTANFRDPTGGNNFYNRYNAPGYRSVYNKLGFSPFRDNDELYNKHASTWNNFQRTGSQFLATAGLALKDSSGFGALSDRDTAKAQQKTMAIGTSTKGGFMGWANNAALNLGYTFGIMAELLVEEVALGIAETGLIAATGATFGATAPLAAANAGVMASRFTRAFGKVKGAWNTASNLGKTLGNLKDANKARTFFKSAGNFINPLENATKFARQSKGVWGTATNLERFAHVTKGAGAFYSDVQQIRLAWSEGALEGGHVQLEKESEFYDSFKAKHGRIPNREEATEIRTLALQAGETTALYNMPFILYSNKFLFDGLVRPKKPVMDVFAVQGKNILFDPKKALMENYSKMPGWLSKKMTYLRNPRMMGRSLKRYSATSFPEGIQEVGQEIISGSAGDYYSAQFEGNADRGSAYAFIGDNIEKQISVQGFETFMSGFLIPAMIGPVTNNMQHIKNPKQTFDTLSMRFTDPKQWKEKQAQREIKINETVEKLNEFYADPSKYLSSDITNMQLQAAARQGEDDAEEAGDTKTLHDIKDTAGMSHVITALEMGRFDTTMQRLSDMKNISKEDLAESYPHLTQEKFTEILDKNIKRGNKIKARWDHVQERMPSPFDSKKYKEGSVEWEEQVHGENAWKAATNELVYNQATFDRALERHESILESAHKDSGLTNTPYSEFNVLFDLVEADKEVNLLAVEVAALQGEMVDPAQKKNKKEKEERLEKLQAYTEALQTGLENTLDETMPEKDVAAIKKAFKEYTSHIGKKNGDYINVDNMDATFVKVMDAFMLKERAVAANTAVNMLLDPKYFQAEVMRKRAIGIQLQENKKNEIRKSLEEFIKAKDKNDMLNELYEAGMFFDPNDLLKLEEEGIVPDTFYSVEFEGQEIAANSEMYSKAISILRKYLKTGSLTNIDAGKSDDMYNQVGRAKLKNDKRTHDDIIKQFVGTTESTTQQTSEVDTKEINTIKSKLGDAKNENYKESPRGMVVYDLENLDDNGNPKPIGVDQNASIEEQNAEKYIKDSPAHKAAIKKYGNNPRYELVEKGTVNLVSKTQVHTATINGVSYKFGVEIYFDGTSRFQVSSLKTVNNTKLVDKTLSKQDIDSLLSVSQPSQQASEVAPETKVPLVQVLQAIIDSKYATVREKELAKKLMEVSDKNYFVTFVSNSTVAGSYSDVTQTVIDARWSSHDYKQGLDGAAIEQVILKQEMHRIADEAVRKDSSFKAEMITLMQEAKMKYDMMSTEDRNALNDPNKKGFEGFVTVEGFIAEAMSNEKFQSFLGTVTSNADNTIQTGWKSFVDKVLRQIGKLLGGRPSGTVLNGAMNAITAKIDSMYSSITPRAEKAGSSIKEEIRVDAISKNTPMSELRSKHPEFANSILEMYKSENETRDVRGDALLDDDYLEKSDEELFKSTAFKGWYKSAAFRNKETAIKEYNKSRPKPTEKEPASEVFVKEEVSDAEFAEFETNGFVSRIRIITIAEKVKNKEGLSEKETEIRKVKQEEITQYINDSVAPVPSHINRDMQNKLRALGYRKNSKKDKSNKIIIKGWDAMSTAQAWKIVYQGLTTAERDEIELADQSDARRELAQQRTDIRQRVQEEIDTAETFEEVMAVRTELLSELSNNPLLASSAGYTGPALENLIEIRLEQIALTVSFDKVEEGMTIILNDGRNTLAEVISKDNVKKSLVVAPLADLSKEEFIKEGEMIDKIKYLNSTAIQNIEIEEDPEITDEDKATASESVEKASEIVTNPEFMDNAYDQSDIDNDWKDEINTCE